ncbi:hypothetical protein [Methylopila sp. M107]|uniref:hypothetical protein n=1 Tax=Methylopila sp. M107 TaxID=1101190 RepID=UPI00035C87C7|nr:hypothetical protein [Methylopila sp. M107]
MTRANDDLGVGSAEAAQARRAIRGWRAAADDGAAAAIAGGRACYDRRRTLPRLIAFDARDLENAGPDLDEMIRAKLQRALRAERSRGAAGHWTYDLNRHLALTQALAAEEAGRRREI